MQYGVHLIPDGCSGRREKENGRSPIVSSLVNLSLQFVLSWEAGSFLTNKSPALTLISIIVVWWTEIPKSGLLCQISESQQEVNKHQEMPSSTLVLKLTYFVSILKDKAVDCSVIILTRNSAHWHEIHFTPKVMVFASAWKEMTWMCFTISGWIQNFQGHFSRELLGLQRKKWSLHKMSQVKYIQEISL